MTAASGDGPSTAPMIPTARPRAAVGHDVTPDRDPEDGVTEPEAEDVQRGRPSGRTAGHPARDHGASRSRGVRRLVSQLRSAQQRLMASGTEPGEVRPVGPTYGLFAASAVFYCCYQLATRGRSILGGSMWAEMGTNYFSTSVGFPWWRQLVTTDAGYIPLPQRLYALAAQGLGVPVDSIPYVYTGGAIVLSALMIGCVCLPAFRPVVASDALRFLLALGIMLVPDFETRTFINFTYFSVVVGIVVTALAAVDRSRDVPVWAWVLPILVLSKPGVLAIVPAVVITALISLPRFRRIALAVVAAALVQAVRLTSSSAGGGSLLQVSDASTLDKAIAAIKYTLGFIGRLLGGPGSSASPTVWMAIGLVAALAGLAAAAAARRPAGVLVPIGFSLVFFTMVVNSFSFSAEFTRDVSLLALTQYERRFIVPIIGIFFAVAGLVSLAVEAVTDHLPAPADPARGTRIRRAGAAVGVVAFSAWFVVSGWLPYVALINQPRVAPDAQVSQWVDQAPRLAGDDATVCIPLDPFGWVYGRNCSRLPSDPTPIAGWATVPEGGSADGAGTTTEVVTITVPDSIANSSVASVGLLVRPPDGVERLTGTAVLEAGDGATRTLHADMTLPSTGGLLQFEADGGTPTDDARTLRITFSAPVAIATGVLDEPSQAVVLWMGTNG